MSALQVEVFPIEATRWIAVIDAPDGPFSTEVTSPDLVAGEVAWVIREVLGADLEYVLVDEVGQPWGERVAREQLDRPTAKRGRGRPLTRAERGVLDALLRLHFPDAGVLRQQAQSVVITGDCQCGSPTVDLSVEDATAPLWSDATVGPRGEVRVHAQGRSLSDDDPFEVILWVRDGRLSLMELVAPPGRRAAWPDPSAVDFWVG